MAGFMDGKKKQSGGNVQREKFGGGSGAHAGGKAMPEDTKVKGAVTPAPMRSRSIAVA